MSKKDNTQDQVFFSPTLDQMLADTHEMLTDIGIPVADLANIDVCIHADPSQPYVAWCRQDKDRDKFHVFLHVLALREENTHPQATQIFRCILHELVHTAILDETGKMRLDHGEEYVRYARMIRAEYGIEIRTCTRPGDYLYIHQGPICEYRCRCGAVHAWYDPSWWEMTQQAYERGGYCVCPYCNRRIDISKARLYGRAKDTSGGETGIAGTSDLI